MFAIQNIVHINIHSNIILCDTTHAVNLQKSTVEMCVLQTLMHVQLHQ